jgi:sialate O-acetylesterase
MRFILGTSLLLSFQFCQTTLAGIFQESGYTQVFNLAIQDGEPGYNVNAIPYSLDISNTIADGSFSRIAYYMELDGAYVWVSVDAFTADASEIGVPSRGPNGNGNNVFQQTLANMNVFSNKGDIVTGTGIGTGNIEFWSYSYGMANSAAVPGASGDSFDFGDQHSGQKDYSSMQIHNYGAAQTLFAYNRFGRNGNGIADLGLGNGTSIHPDWTFAQNASSYSTKFVEVWVGNATVVPEPSTFAMMGLGLVGLAGYSWRRKRKSAAQDSTG